MFAVLTADSLVIWYCKARNLGQEQFAFTTHAFQILPTKINDCMFGTFAIIQSDICLQYDNSRDIKFYNLYRDPTDLNVTIFSWSNLSKRDFAKRLL